MIDCTSCSFSPSQEGLKFGKTSQRGRLQEKSKPIFYGSLLNFNQVGSGGPIIEFEISLHFSLVGPPLSDH